MTRWRGPVKCLLRVFAFADISGYRVKARYDVEHRIEARYDVAVTPHSDAGSSKVPLVSIAFADIPWIPHQVRNDVKHRVEARYDEVTGSSV